MVLVVLTERAVCGQCISWSPRTVSHAWTPRRLLRHGAYQVTPTLDSPRAGISVVLQLVCNVLVWMQVRLKDERTLEVADAVAGTSDDVDFADHVVAVSLGHGRLVVATTKQCKVFGVGGTGSGMASPTVLDLKSPVIAMLLSPQCFLLLSASEGPQVRSAALCLAPCVLCLIKRSMLVKKHTIG